MLAGSFPSRVRLPYEESINDDDAKTTEAEVHAKLLNTTDFEWHPDPQEEEQDLESEALLSQEHKSRSGDNDSSTTTTTDAAIKAKSRYKNTDV